MTDRIVTSFFAEWGDRSAEVVWGRYLPTDTRNGPEYLVLSMFEDAIKGKSWLYVDGEFGEELIPMSSVTSIRPTLDNNPATEGGKDFDADFDDDYDAGDHEDPPADAPAPERRRFRAGDRVVLTQGAYAGAKATVATSYGYDSEPMVTLDLDRPHSKVWHAPEVHVARLADDE